MQAVAVAKLEPEEMRAYLLSHPLSRGGRLWCDRVLEGVNARERTSMRLFGDAMRWTGAQINIAAVFMERLGTRNESELLALVESGRRLERLSADAEDHWETHLANGVELVKAVLRMHPEKRLAVISELGGTLIAANGGTK